MKSTYSTLTKVNKPSLEVALHAGRSLMKRAGKRSLEGWCEMCSFPFLRFRARCGTAQTAPTDPRSNSAS